MAPVDRTDHNELEQQLKDIIQDLYQIMVQVSTYDSAGRPSKDVLTSEIQNLSRDLQTLHTTASPPNAAVLPSVPPELLQYVENGRNPDIYTREFVELVRRGNQLVRGKTHAFSSFRDVLAADIASAMPELRPDVAAVCEATGGAAPPPTATHDGGDGRGEPKTAAAPADANGAEADAAPPPPPQVKQESQPGATSSEA